MNTLNSFNFTTSPLSQPTRKLRRLENPTLRTLRLSEVYNRRNLNKRITEISVVKELDAETGLYYYGARYLDPRTSRWLSGDPAMGEYVPAPGQDPSKLGGMGGVYNIINLHTYHYAGNNPIKYIDPDGRESRSVPPDVARILDERDKVADFYNEVIENGHMVFMGSHNVQIPNVGLDTGRRHSAIIIFVAPGSSFYDNELFVDNTITGSDIRFATLGAGPKDLNKYIFGELFAEPNHSFDVWTVNGTQISSRLQRVNANHEQVSLLIRNDRYFRDNNNARLRYTATPASRTSSYNSNSYTYSLFRSSTIAPPELSDSLYPCWGKEIPRHFFIRTGTLY